MEQTSYPHIDLSAWTQVGEGGNGKTYENPSRPGVILKVNNARLSTLEAVKHEYDVSKAVESMGLPVPALHEIVRVGDVYATISQLIRNKKSLSRICHDEPERIEEMARLLCQKGKELFATPCHTDFFPSRKEQALSAIRQHPPVRRADLLDRPGPLRPWRSPVRYRPPVPDLPGIFLHETGPGDLPHDASTTPPLLGCLCPGIHRTGGPCGIRPSLRQIRLHGYHLAHPLRQTDLRGKDLLWNLCPETGKIILLR